MSGRGGRAFRDEEKEDSEAIEVAYPDRTRRATWMISGVDLFVFLGELG